MFSKIRTVEPPDIQTIVALLREFADLEGLAQYCEVDEDKLHSAMFGDRAIVKGFIATLDDKVVGYTLAYPSFSSFKGEMSYHIEDLFVADGYRNRGVGEALICKVARLAADNGWSRLDLFVLEQNAGATRFYKRLGAESNPDERHLKFSGEAFSSLLTPE